MTHGVVSARRRIVVPRLSAPWWLVEIQKLGTRVVLGLALSGVGIVAMLRVRSWSPLDGAASTVTQVGEVFFSIFGVMYAIIVGLLIVEANRRWRDLSSTIQDEINAIGLIHDCLRYFDDSEGAGARRDLVTSFANYVDVMESDWPLMEGAWTRKNRLLRFTGRGVTEIIDAATKLEPKDETARHAVGKIIDTIGDLTKHRANRLELAEHGLPFGFFLLICFMSLVIVGGVLLLDVPDVWLHGIIVTVIIIALHALAMLLLDMDRPFSGYWSIGKESLADIRTKLSE